MKKKDHELIEPPCQGVIDESTNGTRKTEEISDIEDTWSEAESSDSLEKQLTEEDEYPDKDDYNEINNEQQEIVENKREFIDSILPVSEMIESEALVESTCFAEKKSEAVDVDYQFVSDNEQVETRNTSDTIEKGAISDAGKAAVSIGAGTEERKAKPTETQKKSSKIVIGVLAAVVLIGVIGILALGESPESVSSNGNITTSEFADIDNLNIVFENSKEKRVPDSYDVVKLNGLCFTVPTFFTDDQDTLDIITYYAERGLQLVMLQIDDATYVDCDFSNSTSREEYIEGFSEGIVEGENITVVQDAKVFENNKGVIGFYLPCLFSIDGLSSDRNKGCMVVIQNPNDFKIVRLAFIQSKDSEYDYSEVFQDIIKSVEISN